MKIVFFLFMLWSYLFSENEPLWITDPTLGGEYIGGVGCSKKQVSSKIQRRIAYIRAQAEISRYIQTEVEDEITLEVLVFGDIVDKNITTTSNLKSETVFEIIQKDSYLDKENNLCIWLIKK